jgi:hypothetical protein
MGRYQVDAPATFRFCVISRNQYEAEMLRYSTEAINESKQQMNAADLIHKPVIGRLQLAAMRAAMRTINAVPALRRRTLEKIMRVRGAN